MLDMRTAMALLGLCTATLAGVGWWLDIPLGMVGSTQGRTGLHWFNLATTYALLGVLLSLTCGFLLRRLEDALTRQRTVAESLRASEETLRQITAQVPGMVFRLRFDQQNQPHFLYASPGAQTLFNRDPPGPDGRWPGAGPPDRAGRPWPADGQPGERPGQGRGLADRVPRAAGRWSHPLDPGAVARSRPWAAGAAAQRHHGRHHRPQGGRGTGAFDPASGATARTLDVVCDAGTAFDGTHIYQIAESRIDKIDPATGQVLATIAAPGGGNDSGLTWAEGSLWVGQYRDRKIHQIDPATGAIRRTIESNRFVTGVTWVDGELWHGTWEGDESTLRHIDPASGAVLQQLDLPPGVGVSGLESDGAGLFYCGGGGSGKVRAVRRPPARTAA